MIEFILTTFYKFDLYILSHIMHHDDLNNTYNKSIQWNLLLKICGYDIPKFQKIEFI